VSEIVLIVQILFVGICLFQVSSDFVRSLDNHGENGDI